MVCSPNAASGHMSTDSLDEPEPEGSAGWPAAGPPVGPELSREESDYHHSLRTYQHHRRERERRLKEVERLWYTKSSKLESDISDHAQEILDTEKELRELLKPPERTFPGPASLRWVESQWFNLLASLVVVANVAVMTQEVLGHKSYFWLDQLFLAYFVVELALRAGLHQQELLFGISCQVFSNWLDVIIVLGGVVDVLLSPLLRGASNSSGASLLSSVRVLRLARVLKLANVFMRLDLHWTQSDWFQAFVMIAIGVSSLMMSFEVDYPDLKVWFYWEQVILSIFTFEMAARLKNDGLEVFFCSPEDRLWNYFDLFIVGAGVLDMWLLPTIGMVKMVLGMPPQKRDSSISSFLGVLRILRLFRIMRLLRLIKSIPPLYNLLMGITRAMASMMWVGVLAIVVLYAFGLLTVRLLRDGLVDVECQGDSPGDITDACPWELDKNGEYGESKHPRCTFSSVSQTMFILFGLMNGHMSPFEDMLTCVPMIKPFLMVYMALSCLTILPILTAVVSENMLNSTEETRARKRAEEEQALKHRRSSILTEMFDSIAEKREDPDQFEEGVFTRREFEAMLKEPLATDILATFAELGELELRDLWSMLERDELVHRDDFIGKLDVDEREVHERSMMRFEKRLKHIKVSTEALTKAVKASREEISWLSNKMAHGEL